MSLENTILNPAWWMGVVVVGLVLSIVASYVRTWIDKGLSSVSKKWAERSERSRQHHARHVQHLLEHPEQHIYVIAAEMRSRLRASFFFVVALIAIFAGMLNWPGWFGIAMVLAGALEALMGMSEILRAGRLETLIATVARPGTPQGSGRTNGVSP